MENMRATCDLCHRHGIKVFLDATRAVENAWFIRQREPGYADWPLKKILRAICDMTDGATVSAKKDCLVNIGGLLLVNDDEIADEARNLCVVFEGLHTYGGLAGRDMEAMAIGIPESVQEEYQHARIGQVEYLANQLLAAGIPIVRPTGGHGVFLNAAKFLPHIPRDQFPAQALAAALYVESGVRAMERGAVSKGRDATTGENVFPALELVRLTLPRRVYTQAHMDVTAESIIELFEHRDRISGLRFVYEPKRLRFFQARFEPVDGPAVLRPGPDDGTEA
jgi:tyrosine phenol-lyase